MENEEAPIKEHISALFAAVAERPADERIALYQEIARQAREKLFNEKAGKIPSKNPNPYPGTHEDALEWLKNVWGKYLKFFGADDDYIYQDQLAKLDPLLMNALRYNKKYRNRIEDQDLKLADIIPTKKDRLSKEIAALDPETRKEVLGLERVSMKRRYDERKHRPSKDPFKVEP